MTKDQEKSCRTTHAAVCSNSLTASLPLRACMECVKAAWHLQLEGLRKRLLSSKVCDAQAVTFLVIHQKHKKSLEEITNDLCPVLSVQQLYRISTMYWDDRYNTETVSHEARPRQHSNPLNTLTCCSLTAVLCRAWFKAVQIAKVNALWS